LLIYKATVISKENDNDFDNNPFHVFVDASSGFLFWIQQIGFILFGFKMKIVSLSLNTKGTANEVLNKIRCLSKSFKIFLAAIFLVITLSNYVFVKQFYLDMNLSLRVFSDIIYNSALFFIILLMVDFSFMSFYYLKTIEERSLMEVKGKLAII